MKSRCFILSFFFLLSHSGRWWCDISKLEDNVNQRRRHCAVLKSKRGATMHTDEKAHQAKKFLMQKTWLTAVPLSFHTFMEIWCWNRRVDWRWGWDWFAGEALFQCLADVDVEKKIDSGRSRRAEILEIHRVLKSLPPAIEGLWRQYNDFGTNIVNDTNSLLSQLSVEVLKDSDSKQTIFQTKLIQIITHNYN